MPFYTYKCSTCKVEKEILHGMKESAPKCKNCFMLSAGVHEPKMKRIFKPDAKPGSKDGSWGFGKGGGG